ncbi:DNA-directed RNA polymerase II subunit [Nowakowskiella sp. JEL0407]|nr:DNA-directed RNA polymerase II subunit [Nowakowskiella sp. JEL0407]
MFFLKDLTHTIQLTPQYFNRDLISNLKQRLHDEVEGTCSGRYGYIIAVVQIGEIGRGVLQSSSGIAEFTIPYKAVVFKPFKNQVVDGITTTVNKMGFFADIGPLQCFAIPPYLQFDPASNPPAFVGTTQETQDIRIEKGTKVRIRLVGIRVDQSEIFATGSIKEHFLGAAPSD